MIYIDKELTKKRIIRTMEYKIVSIEEKEGWEEIKNSVH